MKKASKISKVEAELDRTVVVRVYETELGFLREHGAPFKRVADQLRFVRIRYEAAKNIRV